MKFFLTTVFALLMAGSALAQDEMNYLFGSDFSVSGFGGVMSDFSSIDGSPLVQIGGGGGVLANNRIYFGGYGLGSVTEDHRRSDTGEQLDLNLGQGGLMGGYIFWPERVVHLSAGMRAGWGSLDLINSQGNAVISDNFFAMQPELAIEVNIMPFMKCTVGAGYRVGLGLGNRFVSDREFSSPFASAAIYFGWFGD